jgi:hypothetical protein
MYGLSTLMGLSPLGDSRTVIRAQQQNQTLLEIESWLEQAVVAYASRPGVGLEALRVTVMYYEAWKAWSAMEPRWDWQGVSASLVRGAGDVSESFWLVCLATSWLMSLPAG